MGAVTVARTIWCEHALVGAVGDAAGVLGPAAGVSIDVADGRITAVRTESVPPPGAERRVGLTLPGFADAHSHAFHRALRHRTQRGGGTFWTWRDVMYAVAERLDPDRYHRLARAVFAEGALGGYVAVGEFHYVHHNPDGTPYVEPGAMGDALVAAAGEAGVRIALLDTLYLHGGLDADGYRALTGVQRRFGDRSFDAWADRAGARPTTDRVRAGVAVHSVRAVDPASIASAASWSVERDAPLHVHVSEQPAENEQCLAHHRAAPTQVLGRAGALTARTTAVHATHLTDDDIDALGAAGAAACFCPTTERDLGDGIGPARRLVEAGVRLAIGSDSRAVVDPFEEMRAIELDERLARRQRGVLPTDALLGAATGGHACLGWHDAGAIEVGRRADLVTLRLDSPRTAGARPDAIVEAAVFAGLAADVTHVTIDGTDVVVEGRHCTIDVATELQAAIEELLG